MYKKITTSVILAGFTMGAFAMPLQKGFLDSSAPNNVSINITSYYKKAPLHLHVNNAYSHNFSTKTTLTPTVSYEKPAHAEFSITPGIDSSIEIDGDHHFIMLISTINDDTSGFCMFQGDHTTTDGWVIDKCSINKIGGSIFAGADIDHV